jgi:hypothetical protein
MTALLLRTTMNGHSAEHDVVCECEKGKVVPLHAMQHLIETIGQRHGPCGLTPGERVQVPFE